MSRDRSRTRFALSSTGDPSMLPYGLAVVRKIGGLRASAADGVVGLTAADVAINRDWWPRRVIAEYKRLGSGQRVSTAYPLTTGPVE